jgi:hypothetical protein
MQEGASWEAAERFDQIALLLAQAGLGEEAVATWVAAGREAVAGTLTDE